MTFAPGETTKTISIPIVDDATAEVDETLIITIASARLATSIGANATHTLTIASNE
jgi:chitinase